MESKLNKEDLSIMDKTEYGDIFTRGNKILKMIRIFKSTGKKIDNFVILDDDNFDYKETKLRKSLIQTNFYDGGLKEEHVIKAIKKLGKT